GSVEHDPGWSLGGPVFLPKIYNGRNRTVFFTSWEVERLGGPSITNRQLSVPLEAWRKGDFSALLPGTVIRDPFNGNAAESGCPEDARAVAASERHPDGVSRRRPKLPGDPIHRQAHRSDVDRAHRSTLYG